MNSIRRMLARIASSLSKSALDRELDEELAAHVELATEENLQRGMSREQARRAALVALGGRDSAKELHRETRGLPVVESTLQDVRYALRALRRDAGLTTFAVLIVGFGIGAATTVFSVVNALLVQPLPFEEPGRLVWIQNDLGPTGSHKTIQVEHLLTLKRDATAFADIAGYYGFKREGSQRLTAPGEPERLTSLGVTQNFFPLLGVAPIVGRQFTVEECQWNGPKAALLAHRLWKRRFAADPDIVGRSLTINGEAVTVVGVLPETFDYAAIFEPGARIDFFRPFPLSPETNRRGNTLFLIGRLRPGSDLTAARAEVASLAERAEADPASIRFLPKVSTLRERVSGEYRVAMLLLAGAVGLVLLIVCVNLSSLLLTRAAARRREVAVRSALGASRTRLIRQTLVESLLLSGGGALLGLLTAFAGTRLLASLDIAMPLRQLIRVDAGAMGFMIVAAVAIGVGVGLAPAIRASSLAAAASLKEGGRSASESKLSGQYRSVLIVCEVALACTLLVAAGLLTRSFVRVLDVDLGFQPDKTIALRVDPGSSYQEHFDDLEFFDEMLRRVRSIPGVEGAALTDTPPMGHNRQWTVAPKGRVYERGEQPPAYLHVVSEGLVNTLGIGLVSGRDFTRADVRESRRVVLLNETLARTLWPDEDPLGRTVMIGEPVEHTVVGIVRGVRHLALEEESGSEMYLPIRQTGDYSAMHLVVRGSRPAADLAASIRAAVRPLRPELPLTELTIMQDVIDRSLSPRRFIVSLLVGFAGFALILACLGIYAVISYSVSRRRNEIGVRLVLGSTPSAVQRLVLSQTLALAVAGAVVGLSASWALSHSIDSLLFGVSALDPATFGLAFLLLVTAAAVAGLAPARKAAHMDPVDVLRAD